MIMSYYEKARQKHSIKIENRFFEDEANLIYMGTTLASELHA
jgi:hypothetical protein